MPRRLPLILSLIAACGGGAPPPEPPAPPVAPPAPPPAAVPVTRFRAVEVNGTTLHFRLLGDTGAPVVLVHGSLGNAGSWPAQDTAFASRGFRVLVYSRRYHPPNAQVADAQVYSPKLHAEDLAALLLRLDLAPAHVVGVSYGASIGLQLARDHPSLVRSLVLAEPPLPSLLSGTEAGDSVRQAIFTRTLDPARAAFARGDSVAALRAFVDGVLDRRGAFDSLPPPLRADLLRHAFELRLEMLAHREQYFPAVSCRELDRLRTPVLLVSGARSHAFFRLIVDELARCLRTETTVVVPRAGHSMQMEQPVYFNEVVRRFLAVH